MIRRAIPFALAMLAASSPAAAAHKYLPPLYGLVPADFTLAESTAPWLPEQLSKKALAVVVSGNVDASIADWKKAYVKLRDGEKLPDFLQGA